MEEGVGSILTSTRQGRFACESQGGHGLFKALIKPLIQVNSWVDLLHPHVLIAVNISPRTWRGERGEQWSSAQGLESILISIQSLMSSNPYENEPGFENAKSSEDKKNMVHYIAKVVYHRATSRPFRLLIETRFNTRLFGLL
jgi:Ubiquitin-conjugating enzyme